MSTKNCRACNNIVSFRADKCPHCGEPLKVNNPALGFFIIFLVVMTLLYSIK